MTRISAGLVMILLIVSLNGCGSGGEEGGADIAANFSTGNTSGGQTSPAPAPGGSGTGGSGTSEGGITAPGNITPAEPAPSGAPGSGESGGSGTSGGGSGSAMEVDMVTAINQARSASRNCGATYYRAAAPIAWNSRIAAAALVHSTDMALNDFFSHTGSNGSSAGNRLTDAGYRWSAYGENLAVGYASVAAVVQGWLNSEGHCKNIMNATYTEIGAAAVDGTYNGISPKRYWTLDFGRP